MKPIIHDIATKLHDELKANISDFEGLYIFGSQVRGDANDDSDVDIVVLFKNNYFWLPDPFYKVLSQLQHEYYNKIFLDVLPYTREELKRNYIFHEEVVSKGIYYGT